jgi:CRISPR-associated protein Csb2
MPAVFQLYTTLPAEPPESLSRSVFSDDWLVLRRTAGPRLPSVSTAGLARAVRRVILRFAEEPIPEVISGHRRDRTPSERPHLAVVPLPFVGHPQADGAILGIALVVPRDLPDGDRRALFRAVADWEAVQRRGDEEVPALPVHLGAAGVLVLGRADETIEQRTLQPRSWCRPARRWLTVTPIALDRNPGDLRSRDRARLDQAVAEAESAIRSSCQRIGLPAPDRVTVLPHPALPGASKVQQFPPFPDGQGRVQRVLTHAAIEFAAPVVGPVLLGAGRYVGLGLLRPADDV